MDVPDPDKLRLLMTADTVGGVWTYALDLIRALQPYQVEVHLASMGRLPSAAQRKEAAAIPSLHLHSSNYKLEWMDDPWWDVDAAGAWLLELEDKIQPDLIHLNNYCHGDLPWKAPAIMVGHSCVLSWWRAVKGEEAPEMYAEYARRLKAGLQAARQVVAPTRAFLQELIGLYGPFRQARCIPNARHAAHFKPAAKENRILSVGRLWDEAKNIAACELAAARLGCPLEIAGDVQHPGQAGQAAFRHLRPLGQLSLTEVARQMARAAVYVMPARYEPFGLSILEAALSGCALVLGDIPSLRENWQGAALFVDVNSPEDIHEKLAFLMRHPRLRQRLGHLARQRAEDFGTDKLAADYFSLYRRVLENSRLPQQTAGPRPVTT